MPSGSVKPRVGQLLQLKPGKVDDFERVVNIPFEKLGNVTSQDMIIDGDSWGNINEWSEKYDNAIGNYFKSYLPE